MFLIFYLYPAEIFDVNIIGPIASSETEVSMQAFLGWDDVFSQDMAEKGFTVERKLAGWMILIIITIGMPLMFAYRSLMTKKVAAENNKEEL